MANSWNGPKLGSPIRTDVPELQKKLIALLKQDPTSVADIPTGAKRLVSNAGETQWIIQQYNGSSWGAIGKLMHNVDQLDGFHATITPNANTVAVRNAKKQLEGDITGNAATASSATTLSETLPVNKGGTGATTSATARTNLGVPPTSHASAGTTYGLATDTNYGHVRSDGETTKISAGEVVVKDVAIGGDSTDLATLRGQIGNILNPLTITDFNDVTNSGVYFLMNNMTSAAANKPPTTQGGYLVVYSYQDGKYIRQIYFCFNDSLIYSRYYTGTTWGEWGLVITSRGGIMDENSNLIVHARTQTNNDPVYAGFAIRGTDVDGKTIDLYPFAYVPGNNRGTGLVINTNGLLILGAGESPLAVARGLVGEGFSGEKEEAYFTSDSGFTFLYGQKAGYDKTKRLSVYSSGTVELRAEYPLFACTELSYDRLETLTEDKTLVSHIVYDKNGARVAGLYNVKYTNGVAKYGILTYEHGVNTNVNSGVFSCIDKNGNKWGEAPTPLSNSNRNEIATTEWVRNYTLPTGTLIPSFATSMTGYLLCNGAAVSRTTYANLFSLIGTKFGAGNDSTTFNLPDFRNRVFWGASGNLMSVIEAGLPNITGQLGHGWSNGAFTEGGAFRRYSTAGGSSAANAGNGITTYWTYNASLSNPIYGKSTTVQPPAIAVNIFIKY